MEYEYKEEILLDIGPEPNCNYESESNRYYDKIDEIEHVYAQAAKADEYEAKAEAFDKISDCWRTKGTLELGYFVDKAIREYVVEYESGEPNAKK